jgi:hypothetical protein
MPTFGEHVLSPPQNGPSQILGSLSLCQSRPVLVVTTRMRYKFLQLVGHESV